VFNSNLRGFMLKKILFLATIFMLASCQSKTVTSEEKLKVEDQAAEAYQTIEGEEEAAKMNQQQDVQVQEIEVQDRIFFSYDSSDLSDEAKKILDTQVSWLKSDTAVRITVEGHCDERGTREYNIALGEKRANTVKNYLVANGIDVVRIKIVSYGKERPAYFGATDEIFSKNRRAVTLIN